VRVFFWCCTSSDKPTGRKHLGVLAKHGALALALAVALALAFLPARSYWPNYGGGTGGASYCFYFLTHLSLDQLRLSDPWYGGVTPLRRMPLEPRACKRGYNILTLALACTRARLLGSEDGWFPLYLPVALISYSSALALLLFFPGCHCLALRLIHHVDESTSDLALTLQR